MKHKRNLIITSLLLVLTLLVVSCGQAPATETEIPDTKSETDPPEAEDVIEEQQTITQVVIDGKMDDWSGYQLSGGDLSGDYPAGSPDLGNIRAFSNDSYFYMFIEFHEMGNYDHFYFNIKTESDTDYQLTLFKGGSAQIENKSTKKTEQFFAILVVDSGYEFKIPLSAVNNEKINWIRANVSLNTGNGDTVDSSIIFNVDEIELPVQPGNLNENSTRPVHFQLASGAQGDYVYRSFIHSPVGIAMGPDGNLYVADGDGKHIVRVYPDGEKDDLGLWKTVGNLQVDGPRSVAFDSKGILYFANHGHIFRYETENDIVEELNGISGSSVGTIAISPDDELYYIDQMERKVKKWNEKGAADIVYESETFLERGIAIDSNGFLYVCSANGGTYQPKSINKINISTGEETILISDLVAKEDCILSFDPEGDLWMSGFGHLYQISPDGQLKPYILDGKIIEDGRHQLPIIITGQLFDSDGNLWFSAFDSSVMKLESLKQGEPDPDFIYVNAYPGFVTKTIALGHDGEIYTFNKRTREIWKIAADGEIEILRKFEDVNDIEIAINDDGDIYLALRNKREIVILEDDGSLAHVADVPVNSMTFGTDGKLYATTNSKPYVVVQISGIDDYKTFATELAGDPIGTWETEITPAMDKGLYILTIDNENIYFLDFEGNSELVKNVKEHLAWIMAASPIDGTLYFISHFVTPYHLARMNTDGNIDEYGYNFGGDPWAMVVSDDGKWLYVGSSGVISKVPLID